MAKDNDDKKKQGTDISSLLFPAVDAARKREQAFLKSKGKDEESIDNLGAIERLNSANVNASARLYQSHYQNDPWREESKGMLDSPLYSHLPGRLAMRAATRGILGASFMAVGSTFTRTYDWHAMEEAAKLGSEIFKEKHIAHRGMYHIGKAIDHTVGRGIYEAGKAYYGNFKHKAKYLTGTDERVKLTPEKIHTHANRWVTFRGKMNYSKSSLKEYGEEFSESRTAYEKSPEYLEFTQSRAQNRLSDGRIKIKEEKDWHNWNPTLGNATEGFPIRPLMRQFGGTVGELRGTSGQTLGEEIVRVTSDFAMGSTGDALGMEMFSYLDPNVKKDWKDEDGFHAGKLAKDIGRSAVTVLTYRQAEDWAAALPYVYQMKAHRQLIPKIPIFKKSFEHSKFVLDRNAGSSTLRASSTPAADGSAILKIEGDYTAASAVDLQARFMGYNWYTLMFRDLYHHTASKIEDWTSGKSSEQDSLQKDSFLDHPLQSLTSGTSEAGKYVAKSLIKSAIYMAPAVVPFWMVRIPLDLDNTMIFDPEKDKGIVSAKETGHSFKRRNPERYAELGGGAGYNETLFAHISSDPDDLGRDYRPTAVRSNNITDLLNGENGEKKQNLYLGGNKVSTSEGFGKSAATEKVNLSEPRYRKSIISKFLRPVTDAGNWYEGKVKNIFNDHIYKAETTGLGELEKTRGTSKLGEGIDKLYKNMGTQKIADVIAHDFVRGSMAYTPYMMAKAESANLYDTPEMDASIYRMLDGVTSLDGAEFSAGMKDIGRLITLNPVSKVTQAKVYDGRGMAHSKQRDTDSRAKSQGEILTTHHEASKLVSKIKREHEAKRNQETATPVAVADTARTVLADNIEQHSQTLPDTQVTDKNSWQRLHVDQVNRDDSTPPTDVTIH